MRKSFLLALVACGCAVWCSASLAAVRLDIKNDSTEDCSVALNARIDQTTWLTVGWYVYAAGEEAPIILDEVNNIHSVYLYHDCSLKVNSQDETKTAWVKVNRKFSDTIPMDGQQGYEEVTFVRLQQSQYVIPSF